MYLLGCYAFLSSYCVRYIIFSLSVQYTSILLICIRIFFTAIRFENGLSQLTIHCCGIFSCLLENTREGRDQLLISLCVSFYLLYILVFILVSIFYKTMLINVLSNLFRENPLASIAYFAFGLIFSNFFMLTLKYAFHQSLAF